MHAYHRRALSFFFRPLSMFRKCYFTADSAHPARDASCFSLFPTFVSISFERTTDSQIFSSTSFIFCPPVFPSSATDDEVDASTRGEEEIHLVCSPCTTYFGGEYVSTQGFFAPRGEEGRGRRGSEEIKNLSEPTEERRYVCTSIHVFSRYSSIAVPVPI